MSRSASRTQNSVSLFPFLAVLVCAMGALIFLLLVTTRRIRENARAEFVAAREEVANPPTEEEPPPAVGPTNVFVPVPPLPTAAPPPEPVEPPEPKVVVVPSREPDPNVELRRAVESLESLLAEQTIRSTEIAGALATVQDELDATRALAARTATSLKTRQSEMDRLLARATELQRQRAAADSETRDLELRLRLAREQAESKDSEFAFVPYDGTTGTSRRPIYIECTEEGLRFVPEDVLLTEADLIGFTYRLNPLLAGTRGLIAHWRGIDRRDDPSAPEPYVLLLVRPDGAAAYYAARRMLDRLGQPYGYELVPDDFEVALPEPDPVAQRIVQMETRRLIAERDLIVKDARLLTDAGQGGGPFGQGLGGGSRGAPAGDGRAGASGTPTGTEGGRPRGPVGIGTSPRVGIAGQPGGSAGERGHDGTEPREGGARGGHLVRVFSPTERSATEVELARQGGRGNGDAKSPGGAPAPPAPRPAGNEGSGDGSSGAAGPPIDVATRPGGEDRPWDGGLIDTKPESTDDAFPKVEERTAFDGPRPDDVFTRATRGHASSRGGHPAVRRGGIGYEKDVVVEVLSDRIVVGDRFTLPYERGQTAGELSAAVLQGVDGVVAGWDAPPRGFHWVPRVRFRVSTGGNIHYERIRTRIEKTGLKSQVEYELGSTGDTSKRG